MIKNLKLKFLLTSFINILVMLYLCMISKSVLSDEVNFTSVWQKVQQQYISEDGRVIDYSDPRTITTSEGQSYAMFFALVNNDQKTFDKLLLWTINNLAYGDLQNNLPAWVWGRDAQQQWKILDANSASDADLWMAWNLIEAGRLWNNPDYTQLGQGLLAQIEKNEVTNIPGIGEMLIPGKQGFIFEQRWRLNPSYLPIQILTRIAHANSSPVWMKVKQHTIHMLMSTSPKGFAPDWIEYDQHLSWLDQLDGKALSGSYDAIRVYLWLGMLNDRDQHKKPLLQHFLPMNHLIVQNHYPPEKINLADGTAINPGPIGFLAATLPFIQDADLRKNQWQYIQQHYQTEQNYYNNMLILFGLGWYEKKFSFSLSGELLPYWKDKL